MFDNAPRLPQALVLLAALAVAAAPADAHAGRKKKSADAEKVEVAELKTIEETQIEEFDDVFSKVAAIHDSVTSAREGITSARDRIAGAAGLAAGTTPDKALAELLDKANGQLEVVMDGTRPQVKATDAVPEDVKTAIAEVNTAVGELVQVSKDLSALPPQVQELVATCKAFPGQLGPDLITANGLKPTDLPKVAKATKNNVAATAETPDHITALTTEITSTFDAIKAGVVGGGSGAVAASSDDAPAASSRSSSAASTSRSTDSVGTSDNADPFAMLEESRYAFEDAEVEEARMLVDQAVALLLQLTEPVDSEKLVELHLFQAVVAIAQGDTALADAAVARAVAADPDAPAPAEFGPELASRHQELAATARDETVELRIKGKGTVWIDGFAVGAGDTIEVAAGQHLVQVEERGSIKTGLKIYRGSTTISTSGDTKTAMSPSVAASGGEDELDLGPSRSGRGSDSAATIDAERGGPRVGLLAMGAVSAAAGGTVAALAYRAEADFLDDPYADAEYDDCGRSEDCYEDERETAILLDARNIRVMYVAGYSLLGLGAIGLSTGLIPKATVTSNSVGLELSGTW